MNTEPRKPNLKFGTIFDPDYHRYAEWRYERGQWEYQPEHIDSLFENWPHPEPEPDQDVSASAILAQIKNGRRNYNHPSSKLRSLLRCIPSRSVEKQEYTSLLMPVALYHFMHHPEQLPDFNFREPRNPSGREREYVNYWARNKSLRGVWSEPDQDPLARSLGIPPASVNNLYLEDDFQITWGNKEIIEKQQYRSVARISFVEWRRTVQCEDDDDTSLMQNLKENAWALDPQDGVVVNGKVLFLRDQMSLIPIRFSNANYKIYSEIPDDSCWRDFCSIRPPIFDWTTLIRPTKNKQQDGE